MKLLVLVAASLTITDDFSDFQTDDKHFTSAVTDKQWSVLITTDTS